MRKIVFLTGTRADYGKIKALMQSVEKDKSFELYVFITGMHMMAKYGSTFNEIVKDGFKNIYQFVNTRDSQNADLTLSNTITGFSNYIEELKPDLIVVHGDRVEALAGAIVGALNNIRVAHIEGGEISGTIDESIRHAITKFAHYHLVSNQQAAQHVIQLGEREDSVFVIGSPDIDVMRTEQLPGLEEVRSRYDIDYEKFAILLFHPVTTEVSCLRKQLDELAEAISSSKKNYIVIYPNNDLGNDLIIAAYESLKELKEVKLYPSLRFEYFLTLLRHAEFIIGNSSAGIREAGIYGTPAIDIGNRQVGRYTSDEAPHVIHVDGGEDEIVEAICQAENLNISPILFFGEGDSAEKFKVVISEEKFWELPIQKRFIPR
ncbi:UDP-N-acetylglucosamine 2-epimerase (hydrolyzing) [Sporosarcina sp. P21c]|uniref:UDP-N-acetylglucosamine 2-epimerase n=1 Tax=Sporosarcina sp. P21c TaxID=2048255 RepID=UPI000C1694BA|nr:UDP-N-acetylglucosamine 2-epimerase [Sporosarcina sp. P21c]PIC88552.1 UDP-N-acetylglucosamine 2-epimerase (hydrolyzing) [Sporosarcina sp. P21c]